MRTQGHTRRPRKRLRVHLPVFLAVVGLVLLVAAIRLAGPFSTARRQQEELARLRAEKAALHKEHQQLEEYNHQLASDKGLESTVRRKGYVKPGDRLLVFVKDKPGAKKAPAPPPAKHE